MVRHAEDATQTHDRVPARRHRRPRARATGRGAGDAAGEGSAIAQPNALATAIDDDAPATRVAYHAETRVATSWRTTGATCVPRSSIARITLACGIAPTLIWAR